MPMFDVEAFEKAGIPLSKELLKYNNAVDKNGNLLIGNPLSKNLKYSDVLEIMREQNRIETLERYMWINVPFGLTADLIERLLYYRGKGVFYFNDKVEKFQFLPFALNKIIDEYGRYTSCNTFPFTGVDTEKNGKRTLIYEDLPIVYDLPYDRKTLEDIKNNKVYGIILNDSSIGISQQPIIRYNYVKPVIHLMATLIQIINSAMFGAADNNLVQIDNEGELISFRNQIDAINRDILEGRRFTPVVGKMPIVPIKTSNTSDLEGLFGTFNSLTNFLKSITGVANSGVFDKKEHILQEEQRLNGSNADDIYYNGLRQRQEFCLMVQAYYGYPIWCESKRGMTEAQIENYQTGDDNTSNDTVKNGGNQDVESNSKND